MTPSARTLLVLAGWLALAAVAALQPAALGAWMVSGACVGGLLVFDLAAALLRPPLEAERHLSASIALGVRIEAVLRVRNGGKVARTVRVHDRHPACFTVTDLPRQLRVAAGGWAEVPYGLRSSRRGEHQFGRAALRLGSPLGFWWRDVAAAAPQAVRVYPNFRAVARLALLATSDRTAQLGIRKRQRRGEGTEFHQLREYQVGDSLRQIEWRATSRLRRVISKEYREERDQQLIFLLDCGRRMHAQDGELSHLDHSLDAVLLLAYVALRQGDAVGLMTFGGQERRLAPRKGASHLTALLNSVYDLSTTTAASDLPAAVEEAVKQLRKRTLIVLVTNMRDEEDDELVAAMRLASRRHLVLLASLREAALGAALRAKAQEFEEALRLAATHEYLRARAQAHERLVRSGVLCLDVEPHALAASLINRYLDIKAEGLL